MESQTKHGAMGLGHLAETEARRDIAVLAREAREAEAVAHRKRVELPGASEALCRRRERERQAAQGASS